MNARCLSCLDAILFVGLLVAAAPAPAAESPPPRPKPAPCVIGTPGDGVYVPNRWPNGVVHYQFDSGVTPENRTKVRDAAQLLENTATINFVEGSAPNHILIRNSTNGLNWSEWIGMKGGQQIIEMTDWSWSGQGGINFIIVHELMHALGAWHEQQRSDRDDFVRILWGNIEPGLENNFQIAAPPVNVSGPYDFDSVMHYWECGFSNCDDCPSDPGCPSGGITIEALPPNQHKQGAMGHYDYLSTGDEDLLVRMYPRAGDIIEIRDVHELMLIGRDPGHPRNGHYVLVNDIDASGVNFDPIGDSSTNHFRGTLDGQGYRILEFEIDRPTEDHVGLFSVLRDAGTVMNLTIECDRVVGQGYVGVFVGESAGTLINCHVRNASSSSQADVDSTDSGHVGGLVGDNYGNLGRGLIINCSVDEVEIESADAPNADEMGGLAGTNSGTIIWSWAGGEVDGDVGTAENDDIGGLVGINEHGDIIQSYSICTWVDGDIRVGGIVGEHWGASLVQDCYFGVCPSMSHSVRADGLAGGIAGSVDDGARIERAFVCGNINASPAEGALVGECNSQAISDCFWNSDCTGSMPAIGRGGCTVTRCFAKTTPELRQQATFTTLHGTNWDFENVWWIEEDVTYPKLCGVGDPLDAPYGLAASTGQAGGVALEWIAVTYEAPCGPFYRVYRADSAEGPKTAVSDWQTSTSFLDTTAAPGQSYHYWVRAAATTYVTNPPLSPPYDILAAHDSGLGSRAVGCAGLPCPADVTGDGVVNVFDLLAVLDAWGPCSAPCPPHCPADVTSDCVVNVLDLLEVLGAWGPCPTAACP